MKIKDMVFKLNVKSIMFFEQLTKKSFYEVNENDLEDLIYAILAVNNPELRLTKDMLLSIINNNQKIAKEIYKDLNDELQYMSSLDFFKNPGELDEEDKENLKNDEKPITLSKIVGMLIIHYGMDPHYVLYEMSLWEIGIYVNSVEDQRKEEMTDKRFWTYLNILPHVDGKKIGGPEKLVPFPWEKTKQDEAKVFMEKNTEAINNFFKKQENNE